MIIIIVLDDFFYDFSILSNMTSNFELIFKMSKSVSSYNYCWIGLVCWRCSFGPSHADAEADRIFDELDESRWSISSTCWWAAWSSIFRSSLFPYTFPASCCLFRAWYSHLIFTHKLSVVDLDQLLFILLADNIRKIITDQERKLNNELIKLLNFSSCFW